MLKNNLPTYAIVELLIRLEKHNASIGDYKNHTEFATGVRVKTSGGTIEFPRDLVVQQFDNPEKITDTELAKAAEAFNF